MWGLLGCSVEWVKKKRHVSKIYYSKAAKSSWLSIGDFEGATSGGNVLANIFWGGSVARKVSLSFKISQYKLRKAFLRKVSISWASTTTPWLSAMAVRIGGFAAAARVCAWKRCRKGLGGVERQYALQKSGGVRGSCRVAVPVLGATLRLVESLPRRKSLEEVVADALRGLGRAAAVAWQRRCPFPSRNGPGKREQLGMVPGRGEVVAKRSRWDSLGVFWCWTCSSGGGAGWRCEEKSKQQESRREEGKAAEGGGGSNCFIVLSRWGLDSRCYRLKGFCLLGIAAEP